MYKLILMTLISIGAVYDLKEAIETKSKVHRVLSLIAAVILIVSLSINLLD